MNELQRLYRASFAKRHNGEGNPFADYGDYASYASYDSGATSYDSSAATDFTDTSDDDESDDSGGLSVDDESSVASYASSSAPASSSLPSVSPQTALAVANLAIAAAKVAQIVTGQTSSGSPVVAPENTNALIAGLIAQGQNQTAALDAAVASLAANGVDTSSPTLQAQMAAAAAAAAAQVAEAAGSNSTSAMSVPVLLLMLGVAGVAVYMSQQE